MIIINKYRHILILHETLSTYLIKNKFIICVQNLAFGNIDINYMFVYVLFTEYFQFLFEYFTLA